MRELTPEQKAIKELINVMEIQEQRDSGAFHLSIEGFRPLWDRAKENGKKLIGEIDYGE